MSTDWWFFIDGFLNSLKAVLLHKSNMYPALPIGYSRDGKESYETLSKLLELINYSEFKWQICSDLKVVCVEASSNIHILFFYGTADAEASPI